MSVNNSLRCVNLFILNKILRENLQYVIVEFRYEKFSNHFYIAQTHRPAAGRVTQGTTSLSWRVL